MTSWIVLVVVATFLFIGAAAVELIWDGKLGKVDRFSAILVDCGLALIGLWIYINN